ncbi:MAG: helix-turn-helix domain-containing protein [Actinobacteria bacterium]|nr:helix-turn-helix domain-containing protein [Actinomycetota bacterium]
MDDLAVTAEYVGSSPLDALVFGQRLRHVRQQRGLTLSALGERVGRQAPYLSRLENGKREPNLSLIGALAQALDVTPGALLDPTPPTRRAELEVLLERAQSDPLYRRLGLDPLPVSRKVDDEVLEHVLALYTELRCVSSVRAQTPEEARKHNARLRAMMRERANYFADIETSARDALDAVGYAGDGHLTARVIDDLAAHFGFRVMAVPHLPSGLRSLADLRRGRLFVHERERVGTLLSRSIVAQSLGHFALGHGEPTSFGEFLQQRVEANYFAGALLVPESAAVDYLQRAKAAHDLCIEDLAEHFYVSYEMAAHRFTNLATRHLDIATHFLRSDDEGVIWKAYENDGVPFPADPDGAIEGQRVCRRWGTRRVFESDQRRTVRHQYTDTPAGTFWCVTVREAGRQPEHAVTVGVGFGDAKHFRGRETRERTTSGCPDEPCCREPLPELAETWTGHARPLASSHSHVLAALPVGTFPGVDMPEVYEFLDTA